MHVTLPAILILYKPDNTGLVRSHALQLHFCCNLPLNLYPDPRAISPASQPAACLYIPCLQLLTSRLTPDPTPSPPLPGAGCSPAVPVYITYPFVHTCNNLRAATTHYCTTTQSRATVHHPATVYYRTPPCTIVPPCTILPPCTTVHHRTPPCTIVPPCTTCAHLRTYLHGSP